MASVLQGVLANMQRLQIGSCQNCHTSNDSASSFRAKPTVVGLYGLPGCGKSTLLRDVRTDLGEQQFAFYDGSEKIDKVVPGGLEAFKELDQALQIFWRQRTIDTISQECTESGQVAVVAGHYMFWDKNLEEGQTVYTQNDLDTYTHILYLKLDGHSNLQRRHNDSIKGRPQVTVSHIERWQQTEISQLRELCLKSGILFSVVDMHQNPQEKVVDLLRDFQCHNEEYNSKVAIQCLNQMLFRDEARPETVLLFDADRTLAAVDTGALFWDKVLANSTVDEVRPLKKLFSSPMGYSYLAFRQATLLYEEVADDVTFHSICDEVASAITLHPDILSLLRLAANEKHVGVAIVTCGLSLVWEKVLERENLWKIVNVVGGGRIDNGFVMTPKLKATLVTHLQQDCQMYVWAFGDSPLDLDMLSAADQAVVVVEEEHSRSKTMDSALAKAVDVGGLRARQVLFPRTVPPRLNTTKVPLVQLSDPAFLGSVLCRHAGIRVLHCTDDNTTKLMMTQMRDASIAGPHLRDVHQQVGRYLAQRFLPEVIGLEEYSITHVQGHSVSGFRLADEKRTTVIALMRGGEPMAFGINDVFLLAMFVHADQLEDIKSHHLQDTLTVILVDSVINSGNTIVQFEKHIRAMKQNIRIVVVAGVVQENAILKGGILHESSRIMKLDVVALRLSKNKFTGTGTVDTGNRLFNTTHLP